MNSLQTAIQFAFQLLSIVIIADVFLSFFLPPNNQIRYALDRLVQPMLHPIQRFVPPVGNFDFSPVVLLILIEIIEAVIIRII